MGWGTFKINGSTFVLILRIYKHYLLMSEHLRCRTMITGWSVESHGKKGPAFINWPILAVSH